MCKIFVLMTLCGSLVSSAARAQGASLVASGDLVYRDIDRLAELGVVDKLIIGQRPYSRRAIQHIATAARERLDHSGGSSTAPLVADRAELAEDILRRIESRFADQLTADENGTRATLFDGASATYQRTDAQRRGFPNSSASVTEATIDPLADRRLGTPALRGATASLELAHRLDVTDRISFQLRERFEGREPRDSDHVSSAAELLLASIRLRSGNAALTIGRQQFTWAQREETGLFLASDAPALDMISIASDAPFRFPSILSSVGLSSATLVLADLGASRARSHSKLLAYKVSIAPTAALELGGAFFNHFGGSGARSSSVSDRLVDFFPFIDVFHTHNYTDSARTLDVESDKVLGLDGHLRLRALGGLLLSGEILIDDFDVHRLPDLLTGYGSQTFSALIPTVGSAALSLELIVKHLGIITYTHTPLTNGITTRGRLLGDEMGPDAKSFSAKFRYEPFAALELTLEGRSAIYSNAEYRAFYQDAAQTRYAVNKISSAPNELRDIALGGLVMQASDGIALSLTGGVERIRNASFLGGRRNDYVVEVSLRLYQ